MTHFDPELVSLMDNVQSRRGPKLTGQYQEFLDPLLDMVTSFQKDKSRRPTEYDIIQLLQDAERSNSIVVVSIRPRSRPFESDGLTSRHSVS